jgi:SAM-dependent methyltransferase
MPARPESTYIGNELEVFKHARNWKRYWSGRVRRFLKGDVLEVGAGLGTNTRLLRSADQRRWVCLEPDAQLLRQFEQSLRESPIAQNCELYHGTINDLPANESFDAILYIDVLEHIPDDSAEIKRAAARLRNGGRIIVLSPAHNWLFSPFDAAIGHCRRYTRTSLSGVAGQTEQLRLDQLIYLDAFGLFASAANRLLLRQSLPTLGQILFWDRALVPCSRLVDGFLGRRVGKSILGTWVKDPRIGAKSR